MTGFIYFYSLRKKYQSKIFLQLEFLDNKLFSLST